MTRIEILTQAAEHRRTEVLQHQINIDNYRLAIEEISKNHGDVAHLQEFSARLLDLLKSSICEQDKEKILLKVIEKQLGSS